MSPIIWLTGISASGKTTIARALQARLNGSILLDGDDLRLGAHRDLDLSSHGRTEQVRRTAETAKLIASQGHVILVALISPRRFMREMAAGIVRPGKFVEVHVNCPVDVCQRRDPKGLYASSAAGKLPHGMSGLTSEYEDPLAPDVRLNTDRMSVEECADAVLALIVS